MRIMRVSWGLVLWVLLTCHVPVDADAVKVGDRVYVDSIKEFGTVVEVTPRGQAMVRLDKFPDGGTLMFDDWKVKVVPAAAPPGTGTVAAPQGAPTGPQGVEPQGVQSSSPPSLVYPPSSGLPPSGRYKVYKISGAHRIAIGTLEIRGSTYSGVAGVGAFSTMRLNASNRIQWTGGITGLQPGSMLFDGVYQAPSKNTNLKNVIRIYYQNPTSKSTEVLDATLE